MQMRTVTRKIQRSVRVNLYIRNEIQIVYESISITNMEPI